MLKHHPRPAALQAAQVVGELSAGAVVVAAAVVVAEAALPWYECLPSSGEPSYESCMLSCDPIEWGSPLLLPWDEP